MIWNFNETSPHLSACLGLRELRSKLVNSLTTDSTQREHEFSERKVSKFPSVRYVNPVRWSIQSRDRPLSLSLSLSRPPPLEKAFWFPDLDFWSPDLRDLARLLSRAVAASASKISTRKQRNVGTTGLREVRALLSSWTWSIDQVRSILG